MTDLSPREKALVEAVRELVEVHGDNMAGSPIYEQIEKAIRAYDPPKPKIPVLPPWGEYVKLVPEQPEKIEAQEGYGVNFVGHGKWFLWRDQYETLRTLTSKEQE